MSTRGSSHRWLETLLEALYARYDDKGAQLLLRNSAARAEAIILLTPELVAAGAGEDLLASATGENLVLGVLALRLKFSHDEALAKVRRNIAMREGRA